MVYKELFIRNMLVIFFSLAIVSNINAQNDSGKQYKEPWTKRIFVGGNLGLQFGTVTLIDVSPLAGYWITDRLAGGIGATYQYYKDSRFTPEYSTHIFGARVFGRYFIFENIFAHAEYEWLSYEAYSLLEDVSRINLNNILLGGGFRQAITPKSFVSLEVLWNVNETVYTLYQNPVIRIGINAGF